MKPPVLTTMTVRRLRKHLLEKKFAIPKLQRNFVWDPSRAAKLLDSIFRDMPIGSLFLWEMDRKSANLIRTSANVLPPFANNNSHIWFVIDGQQRLSVIHQAFEGQTRENDAGRDIDFGRLCFAVNPDSEHENPPRVVYRKPFGREYVAIRDILAPDWKQRMPGRSKAFLKRIRDCRERILTYPIPVVTVPSATLDEIGEVFIRVNSQGMRITSADRAVALMGKLDVRAMAQELRGKVRHSGFALAGIDSILMGFNLISERPTADSDPPKLEAVARRWSKRIEGSVTDRERFSKSWNDFQRGFLKAVDYLRHKFPVHNESYLPSANMLATLSVFFFHHPGPPSSYQYRQLKRWFWATGIAQRYTGRGYHRNIVSDANWFRRLANGKKAAFVFHDLQDPVIDMQATEYASRSARTRTFFCLLAHLGPRYLDNGETIPIKQDPLSHSNRRHRHHIFPQPQLKNRFSARVYNSLCNICFLVSHDNQRIGMRLPRKYLADYRDEGKLRFVKVMRSHLIPVSEDDGVWHRSTSRGFKEFRSARLRLICKELEKAAGMKLFRKAD